MNPHAEINPRQRRAMSPRWRHCLQLLAAIGCAGVAGPGVVHAAAYPVTIDAMKAARENETLVCYHYIECGKRARDEGYRGIAYLFQAFAASEQVHAGNFGRVPTRLGEELAPLSKPAVSEASARENLILAANSEKASIDGFYPGLLAKISGESTPMRATRCSSHGPRRSSTETRSSRSSDGRRRLSTFCRLAPVATSADPGHTRAFGPHGRAT